MKLELRLIENRMRIVSSCPESRQSLNDTTQLRWGWKVLVCQPSSSLSLPPSNFSVSRKCGTQSVVTCVECTYINIVSTESESSFRIRGFNSTCQPPPSQFHFIPYSSTLPLFLHSSYCSITNHTWRAHTLQQFIPHHHYPNSKHALLLKLDPLVLSPQFRLFFVCVTLEVQPTAAAAEAFSS